MSKLTKRYALNISLIEGLDNVSNGNRSLVFRQAIESARDDDIVRTLAQRLAAPKQATHTAYITVFVDVKTVEHLNNMSERSQLPVEHVARLAVEAYLLAKASNKEPVSQVHPIKDTSNEAARALQPSGEG